MKVFLFALTLFSCICSIEKPYKKSSYSQRYSKIIFNSNSEKNQEQKDF